MLDGMYAKFRFNFNIFERQVSITEYCGYWSMWNLYDFARDMTKNSAKACRMLRKKLLMAMTYILENLALSHNALEWDVGTYSGDIWVIRRFQSEDK